MASSRPEGTQSLDSVGLGERRKRDRRFRVITTVVAFAGLFPLLLLLLDVTTDGLRYLTGDFFTNYASRFPERAGIRAAIMGTFWVTGLTLLISFPVSLGAAIYLEEYAPRNWMTRIIRTNIANLAGVPSIVYGLLGLTIFVRFLAMGRSVLAGALTLSILTIPMVIMAAQEAIRAVPVNRRLEAFGLGASRWQVIRHQVLPTAWPGMISGAILALSRAIGEAAPLAMIGFLTFIAFTPEHPGDPFTVLPLQIFSWVTRGEEFHGPAAAASVVLLILILGMNGIALLIRRRLENRS